ncbi:MAG TPA: ROK family transcriptional regulator [Actinomyces sp.]|nr:ROK family transcriptional regulator [Actinomyces sp.]
MIHSQDSHYAVAASIITDGPTSRTDLANKLNLSAPTLTRITKKWIAANFIHEASRVQPASGRGRPTVMLDINKKGHAFIGVAVERNVVSTVIINTGAEVLFKCENELPSNQLHDVVGQIVACINSVEDQAREASFDTSLIRGISVSIQGRVKDRSVVVNSRYLQWRDIDLRAELQDKLEHPVTIVNNSHAMTMWERFYGVGRDTDTFAMLSVGENIEHGLVYNRQIVATPDQGVGYLDHLPLPNSDRVCYMGHVGCVSAGLSLDALMDAVHSLNNHDAQNTRNLDDVLTIYRAGNTLVAPIVDDFVYTLGVLTTALSGIAMTNTVAINGTSVTAIRSAWDHFKRGLRTFRDPDLEDLKIEIRDTATTDRALAAAIPAIEVWMSKVSA